MRVLLWRESGNKPQPMVLTLIPKLEIVLVLVLVIEKAAAPLLRRAGTGQLRKDQALFPARTANRSRTSTSTMPLRAIQR